MMKFDDKLHSNSLEGNLNWCRILSSIIKYDPVLLRINNPTRVIYINIIRDKKWITLKLCSFKGFESLKVV